MCPLMKLRHGRDREAGADEHPMMMFVGKCNTLFGVIPILNHRMW